MQTGSTLTWPHFLYVLGPCFSTDRRVMMGAAWEFFWYRLEGATYSFSIRVTTPCTNNLEEYEAVRKEMELLLEASAEAVEIFGDSKLVISQLTEEYRCESEALFPIWMQCRELISQFRYINFHWIRRILNNEANDLAQMAFEYKETADGVNVEVQFLEPGEDQGKQG